MKSFEIYWSDLSDEAQQRLQELYHEDVELNPLARIYIDQCPDDPSINPKEVWDILQQLRLYTHYLASKPIAFWDEYDRSNYRSLQRKSGRIKQMYGIYSTDVNQQEASHATTQPKRFFRTKEEATAVMNELIAQGALNKNEVHILWIYKKIQS